MSEDIYWIYAFTIKEGAFDEFAAIARELVEESAKEAGAVSYQMSRSDDGRTVHVFEHYRNSEAIVSHVKNTFGPLADRVKAVADTAWVTIYGEPKGEAREITDSWGAIYMTPFAGFAMPQ